MTWSFVFSGPGLEPHRSNSPSCRMAVDRGLQQSTKLLGHWINRSELLGSRSCTFTGIERRPPHCSNRKKNWKTCAGGGTRCKSFVRHGKRMEEQSFANLAMTIGTWKSSQICFDNIFAVSSQANWTGELPRKKRCEKSPSRNRIPF